MFKNSSLIRNVVIVGVTEVGVKLAQNIRHPSCSDFSDSRLLCFFDDRQRSRINLDDDTPVYQHIEKLPDYVRQHKINVVFITLPMGNNPRVTSLLLGLQDTTASVYFVVNLNVEVPIHPRFSRINGLPIVAVCESPVEGPGGHIKAFIDILVASLLLLLLAPLMLLIMVAVKSTSPGPVFFKQRRCGLNGEEITIYKFRTMTVWEDGENIRQATRSDARVTTVGRFLRASSLDELPQFINVLQGRMSIVGPRPHALAHNEFYRGCIQGYMVRHKVKPGITGWAQIHGYRGETQTVEKMQARIDLDLEYLRNWSVLLDLKIILRTPIAMLQRQNAY